MKDIIEHIKTMNIGKMEEDVKEVDFTKVPLLDKASSEKVGDRIMGQYSEYVSQFYVSDE